MLTGGLLSLLIVTALSVVLPTAAEARCAGVGAPTLSTLSYGGVTVAQERPISGTCNGNGQYGGQARSLKAYYSAVVYIQNNGVWTSRITYKPSGEFGDYQYSDANSSSYLILCIRNDDGTNYICGWGSASVSLSGVPSQATLNGLAHGMNSGF